MARFLAKRVLYELLTLFLIVTATFFLIAGAPGDPIAAKVEQMPARAQAVIREKYGLDRPVVERYFAYMKNLLRGDFGESIVYTGRRVNDVIRENAPISARIGLMALALDLLIGILLGLMMALNRGVGASI
jgi:oligopeptide transport system permease protein